MNAVLNKCHIKNDENGLIPRSSFNHNLLNHPKAMKFEMLLIDNLTDR